MAVGKEIRAKIKSIQSTQKITKAMQMVATSKMRKTQDRMLRARPYANKIREVMSSLASSNPDIKHPMLRHGGSVSKVGVILVGTDKGLCGGLNTNLLRLFSQNLKSFESDGVKVVVSCIGQKALVFARRLGLEVLSSVIHLGDAPNYEDLVGVSSAMIRSFADLEIDRLFVAYNRFVNTMKQDPVMECLLPLDPDEVKSHGYSWSHIYEPEPLDVLEVLIKRYTESVVYQVVVENIACEQAARMMAMKSASDNAQAIIQALRLTYNKARQSAITTELTEIVAGAAAVS